MSNLENNFVYGFLHPAKDQEWFWKKIRIKSDGSPHILAGFYAINYLG